MTAAAIARYLLEFDDPKGGRTGDNDAGRQAAASKATLVDEAFTRGFESGQAAAEARLAEQQALQARELAAAREAWAQQEGARLAEQLAAGFGEIEARLADVAARVLAPFISAELRGRAIAHLVESLKVLQAQEHGAAVKIAGAPDLLEALRARLDGKVENVSYHPSQAPDVQVTVGQTVLETRLGAWVARIQEAVK
jgi:hypothetical protein